MEHSSLHSRRPSDRRELIVHSLRAEGFLSIADLTQKLAVSHMTIRRDLQHLERTGEVRVVYGGVSLAMPAVHESSRWVSRDAAEMQIGRCAAALVQEADTIAIDAGRLGYEIAGALPEQFRGTVVTHSIPVIQLLMSRPRPPRVVGLGGEVMARISPSSVQAPAAAVEGVRVQRCFLPPMRLTIAARTRTSTPRHRCSARFSASPIRAWWSPATTASPTRRRYCSARSDRLDAVVTDERPPNTMERALRRAGYMSSSRNTVLIRRSLPTDVGTFQVQFNRACSPRPSQAARLALEDHGYVPRCNRLDLATVAYHIAGRMSPNLGKRGMAPYAITRQTTWLHTVSY